MTDSTPHPEVPRFLPTATDLRRAAAVLLHADPLWVDGDGLRSIAAEVDADGRGVQLAAAVSIVAHQIGMDLAADEAKQAIRNAHNYYRSIEKSRQENPDE